MTQEKDKVKVKVNEVRLVVRMTQEQMEKLDLLLATMLEINIIPNKERSSFVRDYLLGKFYDTVMKKKANKYDKIQS
jgi:hypothetical protein